MHNTPPSELKAGRGSDACKSAPAGRRLQLSAPQQPLQRTRVRPALSESRGLNSIRVKPFKSEHLVGRQ
jgi:hypothetical protein